MPRLFVFLLSAWLFIGCAAEDDPLPTGDWRATLTVPGGELPFGLAIDRDGDGYTAQFINGQERVPVRTVQVTADSLTLRLPAFNAQITAAHAGSTMQGTLGIVKSGGSTQRLPFRATHGDDYRFVSQETSPTANVSGRWDVTFIGEDGSTSDAVGEFEQDGAHLTGTFLTPTGDHRFLEGTVRGDSLFLSCFDGAHAFLYKAAIQPDGTIEGDFWSGSHHHSDWTAERDPEASLPDPYQLTYLKDGYDAFDFTFPNLDSTLVSLSDPRFDGKVVLVTLAGSWCPNCHDEARFLRDIYPRYHPQGLEVITLMYERYDAFDLAVEQVRAYREKFDIPYPTLIAGTSDKDDAAATLPMLNHLLAYPTALFVDRRGKVRYIHTGFYGPGTGSHHEALKQTFIDRIEGLLAESAPSESATAAR
ncbi:MAG: redoxin domain-containing protein [Bacteroidetes bacterium]|jgi:peroxiredoxin|nr:redoxin domain-containing protein [Bacteroidota bacterium]